MSTYRHNYGLDFCALRYGNVYGPRQDPLGEAGVVAIFTGKMLKGEPVVINGDGRQAGLRLRGRRRTGEPAGLQRAAASTTWARASPPTLTRSRELARSDRLWRRGAARAGQAGRGAPHIPGCRACRA